MPIERWSSHAHRMFAAALTLAVAAACGGDKGEVKENLASDGVSPADAAAADSMIASGLQAVKENEMKRFPCSLFNSAEMSQIAGEPVDSGSYTFVNRNEDNVEWKSEACAWSKRDGMDTVVDVWLSLASHFPSGKVECHPMTGEPKVAGVGDSAWWQYYQGYGLGTIRVCSAGALMEVKVDKGKSASEAETQAIARKTAEDILARLPDGK